MHTRVRASVLHGMPVSVIFLQQMHRHITRGGPPLFVLHRPHSLLFPFLLPVFLPTHDDFLEEIKAARCRTSTGVFAAATSLAAPTCTVFTISFFTATAAVPTVDTLVITATLAVLAHPRVTTTTIVTPATTIATAIVFIIINTIIIISSIIIINTITMTTAAIAMTSTTARASPFFVGM